MRSSRIRGAPWLWFLATGILAASCGLGGDEGGTLAGEGADPPVRPDQFLARNDLEVQPRPGAGGAKGLLARFVQITDIHITDENFVFFSPVIEDLIDDFGEDIGFGGFKRSKAQEERDRDVLAAVVATVNAMDPPASIVMCTGDTTDTALEVEATQAREALNGLAIPWMQAVGNHDDLVLGNIPPDTAETFLGQRFLDLGDFVSLFFGDGHLPSGLIADGHGFALNPAYIDGNPRSSRGFYAIDAAAAREGNPAVRFIVLETTEGEGGANGSIGTGQIEWLSDELEASRAKLVLVFSHHRIGDIDNPNGSHDGRELASILHGYPNVVAHISGHTHIHNVKANPGSAAGDGFWEVQTSSLIDYPQQARIFEIESNGDGTGTILSYVFNQRARGALGESAAISYDAAAAEGFAGSGGEDDRDVELAFGFQP